MKKTGFTLIELLIVVTILGILSAFISGNFTNSLKKGADAKRKTDLEQIRQALELYYEDTGSYPQFANNKIPTNNQSLCYLNDPTKCSIKLYMQKLPTDTKSECYYAYLTDGKTYYKLYSLIENELDNGPGVLQGGYGINCCNNGLKCKFGLASPNTTP